LRLSHKFKLVFASKLFAKFKKTFQALQKFFLLTSRWRAAILGAMANLKTGTISLRYMPSNLKLVTCFQKLTNYKLSHTQ